MNKERGRWKACSLSDSAVTNKKRKRKKSSNVWLVVEKGPFFVRCTIFLATSRCWSLYGSYFQHLHNLACLFLFCACCQDAKFRQCERGELLTHTADIDPRINITNVSLLACLAAKRRPASHLTAVL